MKSGTWIWHKSMVSQNRNLVKNYWRILKIDVFSRYVRVESLKSKNRGTSKAGFFRMCSSDETDLVLPKKIVDRPWKRNSGGIQTVLRWCWGESLPYIQWHKSLICRKSHSLTENIISIDWGVTKWTILPYLPESGYSEQPSKVTNADYLQFLYNIRNKKRLEKTLRKNKKPKFSIGDPVRISKSNYAFNKGYGLSSLTNFSSLTWIATKATVVTYHLKNLDDERIGGKFYENELSKFIG